MVRSKRSFIWDFFTKRENGVSQCNTCFRNIQVKCGSTSNLIKHLKSMHKEILGDRSTSNENGMQPKEEYIVLQGDTYDENMQEVHIKGDGSHYEIIPPSPKAKRSKHTVVDGDILSEFLRSRPPKSTMRVERDVNNSMEIFSRYMISLMEGMPKKKCEEVQLRIVSVILEAKRDDDEPQEKTTSCRANQEEEKAEVELKDHQY